METAAQGIAILNTQPDLVRNKTPREVNERIDRSTEMRIYYYSSQDKYAITKRLEELDRECDIERALEAKAATLSIAGLVFGTIFGRKWYLVPLVVSGFLLEHAITGWCPPVPVLRRLGVRTAKEIERERYALKILRGDFERVTSTEEQGPDKAGKVFESVNR